MTGYARPEPEFAPAPERYRREPARQTNKDYSVPLHVDCSIEYELPDCAKPPQGVKIEPLLMIHPSHFRRLESLRRVPFVNNLPREDAAAAVAPAGGKCARRRCCRAEPRAGELAAAVAARSRLRVHPYVADPPPPRFEPRPPPALPIYM